MGLMYDIYFFVSIGRKVGDEMKRGDCCCDA